MIMSCHICLDLMSLILRRLCVKALLRCRCVSKSWRELIDSRSFILSHLVVQKPQIIAQNQKFEYLVFDPHTLPLFHALIGPELQPEDDDKLSNLCVVNSVHGVVCLYNYRSLLLWNPSIRLFLRLTIPKSLTRQSSYYFRHCGFWIDPSNNHFKIVMFCLTIRKAGLFLSRKKSWIEVGLGVAKSLYIDDLEETQPILVDGVAYWIARQPHRGDVVVCFDFKQDDQFGMFELPNLREAPEWYYYNRVLRKWQDLLSVVCWEDDPPHRCRLWAMRSGLWIKMLSFNLICSITNVFYVVEDHGRVLAETGKDHLVLYDPNDGCIPIESKFIWPSFAFHPTDFVESLVFPDRSNMYL